MTDLLDLHLQIEGDAGLHTNLEPAVGLVSLMQALPPTTEFRTDTSLLWMALTAVIMVQKQEVLSLVPTFPRHLELHDPARHTRLLRTVLEKAFLHPSRLLTYYLRRLMASAPRPLSTLEVLFTLAEALRVEIFAEEQQQWIMLQQATTTLWTALSGSHERYAALVRAAAADKLEQSADYEALDVSLQAVTPGIARQESGQLLRYLLGWLSIEIPAVTALIRAIESTQLHTCLTLPEDHSLSFSYPSFLKNEAIIGRLHHLLTAHLRPVVLRHDELLSPMEATIFLRPAPHAPPFVQIGSELKAGQPLALLEAMKMFTEVTSPIDGILEDILVEDGHGVKTGTPLFKIATRNTPVDTMDDVLQQIINSTSRNDFSALLPFRDSADSSRGPNPSCPISQDGDRDMGRGIPGM
jgi:biotin carboxyl carrier protein